MAAADPIKMRGLGVVVGLFLQLLLVPAGLTAMHRAAPAQAAFQSCGRGSPLMWLALRGIRERQQQPGNHKAARGPPPSAVAVTFLTSPGRRRALMCGSRSNGVGVLRRGLRMAAEPWDQPAAACITGGDAEGRGGGGGDDLREGTRPGFFIINRLTVPRPLPPSALENKREMREDGGISLPMALVACFPDDFPSMSSSRKRARRGEVLSEGPSGNLVELSTTTVIQGGEELLLQQRLQPGLFPQGKAPFELPVIFEDDHLAVVVKPPGVCSHKEKGEHARNTVKTGLAYALEPSRAPEPLRRPMPVHRLDAPTGGLLVAAKSRLAITEISRQFEQREVSKTYRAIVCGRVDGEGSIDMPLGGKESLSSYKSIRVCSSLKHGEVTLVELSPKTGRTHQLRRHMCHGLGKPLVGDKLYTGGFADVVVDDVGLMLWATKIEFSHPVDGRRLVFESEPSAKFDSFMQREQRRWDKFHAEPK